MPHPTSTRAPVKLPGPINVMLADEAHPPGVYLGAPPNLRPLGWAPRPADVPDVRAGLLDLWRPGGTFARMAGYFQDVGATGPLQWERATLEDAALWYVGADMCELLVGAAPGLPAVHLTPELAPDLCGLVVYEHALLGLDADGGDTPVTVGAMLWGTCTWAGYQDQGNYPALGITCYRPMGGLELVPVGSLVWPLGMRTDAPLAGVAAKDASMAEDRRRLAALWLLSAQPGLATSSEPPLPRHVLRREARAGRSAARVRVVQLRQAPATGHHDSPAGEREYTHRWAVSGHWRQQPYGPAHGLRRPQYINPYLKGPEGAPLVTRPKVKAWVR